MRTIWMKKIFMMIFFGGIAVAVFGGVVMLLWNWLIPDLFNGPAITFLQAIGLFLLIKLLTWSFYGGRRRHHWGGHWKRRFQEKFANMSEEERNAYREKFKKAYERGWCGWDRDDKDDKETAD